MKMAVHGNWQLAIVVVVNIIDVVAAVAVVVAVAVAAVVVDGRPWNLAIADVCCL